MTTRPTVLPLFAALSVHIYAHGDQYFDGRPAPHGGQLRRAGPVYPELVVRGSEIAVYVTDHADSSMTTDGGSAKVIIRSAERTGSSWSCALPATMRCGA